MDDDAYRRLFEAAPGNFLVLAPDARFTILAATDDYLRTTHTTREAIVGRGVFEVFTDDAEGGESEGRRDLRASLERVAATGQADRMPVFRYSIPHESGGGFVEHFWSVQNLPLLDADGKVRFIINRPEDVTELVQAAARQDELQREITLRTRELDLAMRELRKAHHQLGDLDRAKTRFFNDVSHEFRTPLTLMLPDLEDLLAGAADPLSPAQRERVRLVQRNALRMLKLVNALLDFSQFEAGRTTMRFVPTDLAALTREVASAFETPMARAGLRFAVECPALSEPLFVDPDLWEKIVLNLVSNAYKYTLHGGVTVRLREAARAAVLEVEDTGAGIPDDQLPRMFDRFHRVRDTRSRSYEGTGIGLALVAELVKAHGGTIDVRSGVGVGSTFCVSIPKGSTHLDPATVGSEGGRRAGTSATRLFVEEASGWEGGAEAAVPAPTVATDGRAKVLVVDDNADIRRMLQRMLSASYAVVLAADGAEALERLAIEVPDLVLTDSVMPRLDGAGLLRAIRQDPRYRDVPVLMLSGRVEEQEREAEPGVVADDYLLKPFSNLELLARIKRLVLAARERAALAREVERLRQARDRG